MSGQLETYDARPFRRVDVTSVCCVATPPITAIPAAMSIPRRFQFLSPRAVEIIVPSYACQFILQYISIIFVFSLWSY
jgi:hypothetical protein